MTEAQRRHLTSLPGVTPEPDQLWRDVAGSVLRRRRLSQGWTLQQVALRAGLSAQYLSEIERGRKEPSSEMLESVCGALGLRLVDLLIAGADLLGTGHVLRLGFSGSRVQPSPARPIGPVLLAG